MQVNAIAGVGMGMSAGGAQGAGAVAASKSALSLGKIAKNMVALQIIDGFLDAQAARLSQSGKTQTTYGLGSAAGQKIIKQLVTDALALSTFQAVG